MSDSIEARLGQLGLELPQAHGAMGLYSPAVTSGNLVFIAGQGAVVDGKIIHPGRVGAGVSIDQAREAARLSMLNVLAQLKRACGDLDRVVRCVRTTVYVCSAEGFTDQPRVGDGATEVLETLFGRDRLPARTAVGVYMLPANICVEVDAVFELKAATA